MPPDAIKIKNLHYSYPGKMQPFRLVIPEWRISKGDRIFLKGASGSGKSTLLNLLAGILVAKEGAIEILGQDISVLSARERDFFRAIHVGIVFQQFNLVPYLSVYDNIRLAAYFGRKKQSDLGLTLKQLFTVLNLDDALIMRKAGNLSVGQQQRAAIARALVNNPEILIVDEPTSALDNDLRDAFMDLLLEICRVHASTLIFVSHDATLTRFFDTVVNLSDINQAGAKAHVF